MLVSNDPFSATSSRSARPSQLPTKKTPCFLGALSLPVKDDDPDYPALVAGNFILGGGGLSSRLADRLRQKDGLSYGAMSMFLASPFDPRADLMIMAIYNPTNLDKVVSGVDDEFSRLVKDGVKTVELDQAKVGWIEEQSLQRTRDMPLASQLATNLFTGRTMQFQADLEQKVKALTPEIVNAAIKKHLDPKRLSAVTAGDFKKK